jgi:hypothetical protein
MQTGERKFILEDFEREYSAIRAKVHDLREYL